MRALVRRKYVTKSPTLQVLDLEINTSTRTCTRAGKKIELTAKEYGLLEFLLIRTEQVVSRSAIWDNIYDVNSDAESNVVDVFITTLRKKIEGPGLTKLIHTRRGHGYMLSGEA